MATHPFGCHVIQRVMEKCNDQQIQQVWIELMKSAGQLMQVRSVFFNKAGSIHTHACTHAHTHTHTHTHTQIHTHTHTHTNAFISSFPAYSHVHGTSSKLIFWNNKGEGEEMLLVLPILTTLFCCYATNLNSIKEDT